MEKLFVLKSEELSTYRGYYQTFYRVWHGVHHEGANAMLFPLPIR